MKRLSIRLRLTLWYSVVLAAALALFAGSLWWALRHALYSTIDANIHQHIRMVKTEIAENLPPSQLLDELKEYGNALPDGYSLQVDPIQFRSGPVLSWPGELTATETVTGGGRQYAIIVRADLGPARDILARLASIMLLAIPACLVLAGFGGLLLSRRALAPVDEVTAAARSITIRNLSQRLTVPTTGDELQRLSEAWNETLERLDGAVKRLTQFTADASHELRTPIALIRTASELALRRDRAPAEYRESLMQIHRETERTSQLIDDLLALARADAGDRAFTTERIDLGPLVREACDRARALAQIQSLAVASDIPDEAIVIDGNEPALRRLFSVLVDNAVKYTPSGEVRIGLATKDGTASVQVQDTGIGMSDQVLPHIFERFYRADESRNRAAGGAGLGLSIAEWIAARHGARIQVESKPGSGSTFQVLFPRRIA